MSAFQRCRSPATLHPNWLMHGWGALSLPKPAAKSRLQEFLACERRSRYQVLCEARHESQSVTSVADYSSVVVHYRRLVELS